MKVNVLSHSGFREDKPLEFSGELDLSHITYWGQHPFHDIHVQGIITRLQLTTFRADYSVTYTRKLLCGRCLKEIEHELEEQYSHLLQEVEREDSVTEDTYIPVINGILDVTQMVSTDLFLKLDDVALCSQDCKGICPVCGGDRNEKDCGCSVKTPDPRFDKLRELLDKSPK